MNRGDDEQKQRHPGCVEKRQNIRAADEGTHGLQIGQRAGGQSAGDARMMQRRVQDIGAQQTGMSVEAFKAKLEAAGR